jgi:peptidoglycan hydrolase-like protein with peptidoglycan-binding domain
VTKREIVALQQSLNQSGFAYQILGEALKEDGIYGPATDRVHRAWLDRDTRIPTVTPPPAKPWWQSRAVLGLLASLLAMIAGRMGWGVDEGQITDVLLKATELGGLVVAAWGTIRRQAPIDSSLVARVGTHSVRLPVRPERQGNPDDDPRGVFRDR